LWVTAIVLGQKFAFSLINVAFLNSCYVCFLQTLTYQDSFSVSCITAQSLKFMIEIKFFNVVGTE
jgi:hypothetical protein